jgi:hypothetical protein
VAPGGVAVAREGRTLIDMHDRPEIVWVLAHWPEFLLATVVVVLAVTVWWWARKDARAQVANYHGRARR